MSNDSLTAACTHEPNKNPIINCHTHIFTGDHVAPFLAKSIIRKPFYRLLNFKWIFSLFRKYYSKSNKKRFDGTYNLKARKKFEAAEKFRENYILYGLYIIAGIFLTLQSVDILFHYIFSGPDNDTGWCMTQLYNLHDFLYRYSILIDNKSKWLQAGIVLLVVLFYKSGRNLLLFIAKNAFSILRKLPGKETKKLIERYLTIGRFAFHTTQWSTLGDLKDQYPDDSGFVILPMDMEFMDAGEPSTNYKEQMQDLAELKGKNHIYPFVFADPRRIEKEGTGYFDYEVINGKVILRPCFIQEYIEQKKFSGFKIYPALGYYPFDPLLLPLWKYAEQNNIPILTHCVRGPMYYRGAKKKEWNYHPVFEEVIGEESKNRKDQPDTDTCDEINKPDIYAPLLLPETGNSEFSANFTHPLNFICLLKKRFLAKAVEIAYNKTDDPYVKQKLVDLFEFVPSNGKKSATVNHGLDDLKICLGHYGGGDEWNHFFEKDRYKHSAQILKHPETGIDFLYKANSTPPACSFGKPEQLWKYTDWYSIISSMMLQHDNVYADISYILHNDAEVLPLLKQTLINPGLREKVLFGTDFYVVRNHKSDKNMLATMMGGLDEKDFNVIARDNPRKFLNLPDLNKPVQKIQPLPNPETNPE
jgi:predicted TIM-barrel fold metal-dependent hydrolase